MILKNPEARRGLRSVVQAIVALVVIGLVAWIVHLLAAHPVPLENIALACLAIVALGTTGYIAENTVRAIKLKGFGVEASIGDAPEAAQAVADAAQDEADSIGGKP